MSENDTNVGEGFVPTAEERRAAKLPEPINKPYEEIVNERNNWEEEARRYSKNSDFWRGKFGDSKKVLLLVRRALRWLQWHDPTVFSDRKSMEAQTSDAVETILADDNPQPELGKPWQEQSEDWHETERHEGGR